MNIEHRFILNEERDFLVEKVNFQHLKPLLLEYKIFNKHMWKDVVSMDDLLDALPHRGPEAFHNIIEILRKTGYNQEADVLENHETTLFYKISSRPLGYCLIINNVIFDKLKQERDKDEEDRNRYGSDTDAESLSSFFENAGFNVIVERNMKAVEMTNYLQKFSKHKDLTNVDSLIVIIMSHGAQISNVDIIYGTDWDYIKKPDVRDIFNNENCKLLLNKPKIFIFMSCRGRGMDYGVNSQCLPNDSSNTGCIKSMEYDIECLPKSVSLNTVSNIVIPTITDTFFVHSTLPCQVSPRDPVKGTNFCQVFIDVLNRNFQVHDLHTIINNVNVKLLSKVSPLYHIIQSAHYETLGTRKSIKFCRT